MALDRKVLADGTKLERKACVRSSLRKLHMHRSRSRVG
nr:hypothetical protein [uncultured bacterium]